jgi:aminopeptidase N
MERYSYANACTENLWECLGTVKGTSVADIMDCWVSNVGFPLIKVNFPCQQHFSAWLAGSGQLTHVYEYAR